MPVGTDGKYYMKRGSMKVRGVDPDAQETPDAGAPMSDGDADDQDASGHGQLKHVEIHPKEGGGFHVHGHYHHPEKGHHVVSSEHGSPEEASAAAAQHMASSAA